MRKPAAFLFCLGALATAAPAQDADPLPPLEAGPAATPQPESSPAAAQAAPEPAPAGGEQPSAELINEAEQTVAKEPEMSPSDEPLPQLEGQLPGDQNIFGDDLFGAPDLSPPSVPEMPPAPPVIEDPSEMERKMRVKFRKLKANIENSPDLVSRQEMARTARTPEDYRAARRSYYALFFEKIRRADSSLKDYADKLEKQSLADLYQTRIEPTVPLNPPPEPQPAARFLPPNQLPDALPTDEEPVALP